MNTMATATANDSTCDLVQVGSLKLEHEGNLDLDYISVLVLSPDKVMVVDYDAEDLRLYNLENGHLLAVYDRRESVPQDICICSIHDKEIQMALGLLRGQIEIISIKSSGQTSTITMVRKLDVRTEFEFCFGLKYLNEKLLIIGKKQDNMLQYNLCWGIVSITDGHVDKVHKICKCDVLSWSYLSTNPRDDNMVYISYWAGDEYPDITGVYGYRNSTQEFLYQHKDLVHPTGMTVDRKGFIFVCNLDPDCIHQLTEKGHEMTIYREGMPSSLQAIFWEEQQGLLYVASWNSNMIHMYRPMYSEQQGPVIPMEILRMDERSLQLYKEALQDGKEKVYNIRVMVVGQYGVGKTTLTKRLLGQQVDISVSKSTEGIDVYKHCCKVVLETGEWIVQLEDSDQLSRLERLVKLLTGQAERPEVSSEQDGQRKVINQRETSTENVYGLDHDSDNDDDDNISTSSVSGIEQKFDINSKQMKRSSSVKTYQRHVTSKDDATMEFLQLVNRNADKLHTCKTMVEYAALAIWDFAGQYVFYTTHQTFLTRRAIYLLVTDLSKQVTDLVNDECPIDTEGVRLCQVQDLVEIWLNSIHCCASSPAAGTIATSPAAGTIVTSPAAGTPVTFPASGITVTFPVAGTTVTSPAAGSAVTYPVAGTTITSRTAGSTVPSPAPVFPITSPAAGSIVTSPKPSNTVKSLVAGTASTSPEVSTTMTFPAVGIPLTPPVILVGTHVDKIQEDKRQEVTSVYFKQICRVLKDKPTSHNLVDFVAIDNTHFDPELKTLKDRIFQLAKEQPYWGEEVPTSWLPLEEALMKLKALGKKVIRLSLFEELNQAASVPIKTAEQLDLFLRFQHEIGTILYFSVEGLREKIVLDPQWLIDALKSLITAEMFILKKYPTIRDRWFEFKDKGKLTPELIGAIWSQENNPEFHDNKEHILLLMEKLNVIAKPRSYFEDRKGLKVIGFKEENYYLAPCMFHQAAPKEIICPEENPQIEKTSILCLVSTGKFLPPPVFHRLLAACVSHWQIATQKEKTLIFCGCCVFDLDHHHRLTLYFREYIIFVQVTRIGVTDMYKSSKLCIEARNFILENLTKIIANLGQSLQFEQHIKCPDSDADGTEGLIAVSLLQKEETLACHSHDKSHMLISQQLLKFWFEEEETSSEIKLPANNNSTTNSLASKDITGSTGVTGGNVIGAARSTPSPGNAEIQKYLLTDAAQNVLDMGFQPKLVQQAIERVLLKKGTEELTKLNILEAVLNIEEEDRAQLILKASIQSAEGNESRGKACGPPECSSTIHHSKSSNTVLEETGNKYNSISSLISPVSSVSLQGTEYILKEHFDVCIIYCEADEKDAYEFKDHLEKLDLGHGEHPKICLYTEEKVWGPTKLTEKARFVCKHCTLIFVYLSKRCSPDEHADFFRNEVIMATVKNCRVRPVLSEKDCTIPFGLNNVPKIEWYKRNERSYKENILSLFDMNKSSRLSREAEGIKSTLSTL